MEKIPYKFGITLLFLLSFMPIKANNGDGDIQKEKTVSKVYLVNSDAGIDIQNKYGNIYVTTWDEDKIAIDVVIKVKGKNEDIVNRRLDAISIDINALKSLVTAKTVFDSFSGKNVSMEINYTIKLPTKGSVTLDNQYGNIVVDKILGKSNIECKYGSLSVAELQGNDNHIKMKYSDKSSINYLKSASVDAKYSDLKVTKAGNLTLSSDYTNVSVKEMNNLKYDCNYGDLNIAICNNIQGNGDYLGLKFGTINGNLEINTDYSRITVQAIDTKAKNITINSTYTNVDMKYESNYAFDFEFNLKYANLESGLSFQSKRENITSSYYKGFYKNSGINKVNISSNYGNIKLTKI